MGNGYVKTASTDPIAVGFPFGATLGRTPGHTRVAAYGFNGAPAAGADVWVGQGAYPFQSSAQALEIVSSSANDAAAGTGARTVVVQGLDANFNQIQETVTLNGTSAVALANSYLRVNGVQVASAGSGNVNAGTVTLRLTGAGASQAVMSAGVGYAKQAIYTVPAGFTLLVTDLFFAVGGVATTVNVTFSFTRISSSGLILTTNEYPTIPFTPTQRQVASGTLVASQTTLTTRITGITSTPPSAYAGFEGILVANQYLQ
ncbi:hypothetical protein [Burkholderia stagnalis]|uniref:hypothetical protein n=1 Tax=Burkholderia stagnalis TaxID=1503054 RepID=UPI000F578309|nr:hypothetical protein [Burkholderia stagnalis]RQQ54292.1 hypothetical protein DF145_05225 [Burkholderia stagnalis]RQY03943.1 hypothetical protein DF121_08185 [Burkholderia stagnalis]RQY21640.1 hypothetical protein DF115_06440 [Burkholderia stagnalis]RQY32173.1 hypothetical protein DF114_12040 [Burkholderia stagnalis]